jgi:hypothetical protein
MSNFTINNRTYSGNSIRILGNEVWIDGKRVKPQPEPENGILRIDINGSVDTLISDANVHLTGTAGTVRASGNVQCGNVERDVSAGGNIHCGQVLGNVSAGGNVVRK